MRWAPSIARSWSRSSTRRSCPRHSKTTSSPCLQQVLQGLEKVTLPTSEISKALTEGGTPCTVSELKGRFEKHLDALTRGKDPAKVRIVIE